MTLFRPCTRLATKCIRTSTFRFCPTAQHSTLTRQFKVTLDGETLYIDKELAEALGWKPGLSVDGPPLRLSGWEPHYFAITRPDTDADLLARGTIESSRNSGVQHVLEYLKKKDAEP